MDRSDEAFSLPEGPKGLCFNKNEFMKKAFSVDEFLQENRNAASLETMRDDLGIYLKVLRSAMIELINKDYADFVNLSANLVGLDVFINSIQTPLGQLKEEILLVRLTLTDVMSELKDCLEKRSYLRNQKRSLQNLLRIRNSISKLDTLLMRNDSETTINPALLERITAEFNQLEFCMSHCSHLQGVHRDSRDRIHTRVRDEIDNLFRESLKSKSTDILARVLQMYIALDKITDAENLFCKEIIAPAMDTIISENNLQSRPDGLRGVYNQITNFIEINMSQILSITQCGASEPLVQGCNFILNSLWPEIETRLENHMSSIFAPGNPDMFYEKYYETIAFLSNLETFLDDESVAQFHQHDQYKNFQQRWNLPVYFQIRFQEIGSSMEIACSESLRKAENSKYNFQLSQTITTWESILRCWAKGVFLKQIAHRFWKLTLQLISRYNTWSTETISNIISITDKTLDDKIDLLVILYIDIQTFVDKIPEIYTIAKNHLKDLSEKNLTLLKTSLDESKKMLLDRLPDISNEIIKMISARSIAHIKQVNDIPRLFRKTNRETPSKPCPYVASIVDFPMKFYNLYKKNLMSDITPWLENIFSDITEKLHSSVSDVLTSVQKTEESLRRLKQIRDRANTTNVSEKTGMSDDDKIRLQLLVDVTSFSESIKKIGIKFDKIKMLKSLILLVENAAKIKLGQIK